MTYAKELEGASHNSNTLQVVMNVLTTFLVTVSMGMLAVLVPVHLSELEFNDAMIAC